MLVLSRKSDEKVIIDDEIVITVVGIEKGKVKLGIDAPTDIEIFREEVYKSIEEENIAASHQKLEVADLKEADLLQLGKKNKKGRK